MATPEVKCIRCHLRVRWEGSLCAFCSKHDRKTKPGKPHKALVIKPAKNKEVDGPELQVVYKTRLCRNCGCTLPPTLYFNCERCTSVCSRIWDMSDSYQYLGV